MIAIPAALARGLWGRGDRSARSEAERAEMLSLVLSVCAVIVVAKYYIAYRSLNTSYILPQIYDDKGVFASLCRVLACCAEDFAVGIGCLLVGLTALHLAPPGWPRRTLRVVAHLAAVAALLYLLANVKLFLLKRDFLRLHLFLLGGGGFKLDASVLAAVGPILKLAFALVPILTLAAHLGGLQVVPGLWRGTARYACRPLLVSAFLLSLVLLAPFLRREACGNVSSDYSLNPHLLFVRSLFRSVPSFEDHGDGDVTDFVPNRPGHTASLLTDSPKNLILIVAESLSTRWVETYGCPLPTTPNLRRLADRSLTFENFYATANYSLASALPILAGVYNEPTVFSTPLNWPGFPMPAAARWLRAHGYRTYFLGSGGEPVWAYYEMGALFGTDGFDVGRNPRARFWQSATDPQAFLSRKYRDPDLFADARRVVGEERGNRFALFLWAYDTHALYAEGDGPDDWRVEHFPLAVRGHPEWEPRFRRYLRAVWRLDKLVGELCAELEVLGLAEDTLIVLTGDHGEAFGEHGRFFHEWFVYEEEVRVPLILINPRLAPLGKRSPVLGSHIDLWATITDICALPADPHWQGRSLVGGTAEDRRAYFQALAGPVGLREGRWKYIWDTREACHVLFDLDTDPHERNNIAADHPQRCAEMYHRVATWVIYQRQLSQRMLTNERH